MTRYYGIKCKTCETPIAFGECAPDPAKAVTFYTVPLDAVPCNECGSSYLYGSDDLFEFEAAANIPVFRRPEKSK